MIELNQGRVLQALDWAMTLHKEQRRKGKDIPYITHLLSVASKVLEYGGDEDQFISALLHDSVEDQNKTTISEIEYKVSRMEREGIKGDIFHASYIKDENESKSALELLKIIAKTFGSRVANYVEQCSDSFTYPKKPWKQRKEEFIARCYTMLPDVKLIVACDKWHNLYSTYHDYYMEGDIIWSQFNGKKEGTLWYYREVIQALKKDWEHPILFELDFYFNGLTGRVGFK